MLGKLRISTRELFGNRFVSIEQCHAVRASDKTRALSALRQGVELVSWLPLFSKLLW
jgi:hypothetical protein